MSVRPARDAALMVPLVALSSFLAPAALAGPVADTSWGWVVVRNPSQQDAYTPAASDRGNSTGADVSVSHGGGGVGHYAIRFEGLTASSIPEGGVVHVTPISSKPRVCRVDDWTAIGSIDLEISASCYKLNGDAVDTQFALSFLATGRNEGTLGYMRLGFESEPLGQPTEPEFFYSFNSSQQPISVTRTATGTYQALFEDLNTTGGSALVTSWFKSSQCRLGSWSDVTDGVQVGVRCYNASGALADSEFLLSFMDGLGLKGVGGSSVAYLYADQPKTSVYTPPAAVRFSTEGGTPKVRRLARGLYRVVLPNFESGGAAIVSAAGEGKNRCQIDSLPTAGSPKKVTVRCFTPDGVAANSRFTLSFVK